MVEGLSICGETETRVDIDLDQRKRRPGKERYSMYCRSERSCRLSVTPQLVIATMQDERSLLAEKNE